MNTPHNKDRVIDEGFKNTIRNGLGLPFHLKMASNSTGNDEETRDEGGENLTKLKNRTSAKSLFNRKPANARNGNTEVYTLSTTSPLENQQNVVPNALQENPSTSKGIFKNLERRERVIPKPTAVLDEDDSDTGIQKPRRFRDGEAIMCEMRKNINIEKVYLHYFLQLIQYEENIKNNKLSQNEFAIVLFQDRQAQKKTQSKGKGVSLRFRDNKKLTLALPLQSSVQQSVIIRANLLEKDLDRIEMRRVILENFEDYCNDEESYNKYLTELIDLEENLIQN